ncbi:STY4526/YPO1902 family pathogenicity island replication protein [Vibrio parahaemolyticus]|uniref:STY4526/YPO1902 family pathogenicity island replication protein n=1 Tax=Vibrio parahaemolyticus TaxID=670 RepID=UPI0005321E76|nr:STY4526/YPO1902 family pathogenicity island replication protein [Vibrio parahaemolyticus]KGT35851.1 hypothetical protein HC02_00960 [Vibrio parahaemolyticus]TOH16439.1 hypothetical protein CGI87_15515 [Vibrio parahaemolyticus]HBC3487047.1 DUF2857 family protein [Vibrio parahaemolyticus]
MQEAERLKKEVCFAVYSRFAQMASSGEEKVLKGAGMSDFLITRLAHMSLKEMNTQSLRRVSAIDMDGVIETLFSEVFEMPDEWREFLTHGATNKMMKHYFGARPADCQYCRGELNISASFRGRAIGHKKHSEVCESLHKVLKDVDDFRTLSSDVLLEIAKEHQVSLGALWNQFEKWERVNEQEKNPA